MTATVRGSPRGVEPPGEPERSGSPRWGRWLAVAATAPAAAVVGWLLGGLPLLVAGIYRPFPVLVVCPLVAAAFGWAAGRWAARCAGPARSWVAASVLLIALGAAGLAAVTHSEQVVLRRDAGSYAQIGHWISQSGQREVPVDWAAFGGRDPALHPDSPAFYYRGGDNVDPQFMSGLPMLLAVGRWAGGWNGLLALPALFAGLAVLAFAGLAARTVGDGWAPLAALGLALSYPVLQTARGTYSEPLAQLLLLGGLTLLSVALRGREPRTPSAALLAGIVLGAGVIVRIDALREVALLVPVIVWLAARRRPEARPFAIGLSFGTLVGLVDGLLGSRPYLEAVAGSLVPLAVLFAIFGVGGWWVVRRAAAGRLPKMPHLLPVAAAWAVVGFAALLVSRPLWLTDRQTANTAAVSGVRGLQRAQGLPVDPTRTYSEYTVTWVHWWVGPLTLALAVAGAAVLVHGVLRRRAPHWTALLPVLLGSSALTLARPSITPDHPWADRRLVVVVLPAVILFACWALRFLVRRLPAPGWRRSAAVAGGLAMLVPIGLASASLIFARTERGEIAAMNAVCGAFRPGEVALMLDRRAGSEWSPAVRQVCGVPTMRVVVGTDQGALARVMSRVRAAGREPVLMSALNPDPIAAAGVRPEQVVALVSRGDARTLVRRPSNTARLYVNVWLGREPG